MKDCIACRAGFLTLPLFGFTSLILEILEKVSGSELKHGEISFTLTSCNLIYKLIFGFNLVVIHLLITVSYRITNVQILDDKSSGCIDALWNVPEYTTKPRKRLFEQTNLPVGYDWSIQVRLKIQTV